jgi:hypothetical protein
VKRNALRGAGVQPLLTAFFPRTGGIMKLQFFSINALEPETEQAALDAFCTRHRVVSIDKRFVERDEMCCWSICITYLATPSTPNLSKPTQAANKRGQVDYRELLNEQDFAVYAKLRNLRKLISEAEGTPILFGLLQRHFKGEEFLGLLWRIIDSYHAQAGKGLPIGSLTSQHFANHYLAGADRFLLENPVVRGHVRYMDDILCWCNTKEEAKATLADLHDYLHSTRQLLIKPTAQINRSNRGVSYCGYRVLPGAILLSHRKRQRYQQLRLQWELAWRNGKITELELQQAYQSVHAITLHADSRTWRKQNLQLHPSSAIEIVG